MVLVLVIGGQVLVLVLGDKGSGLCPWGSGPCPGPWRQDLVLGGQVLVLGGQGLVLVLVLGVRSLSWSLGVRFLSWSLWVSSLLTSLV